MFLMFGVPYSHRSFASPQFSSHSSSFFQVLLRIGSLRIDSKRRFKRHDALLHFPQLYQSRTQEEFIAYAAPRAVYASANLGTNSIASL